MIKIIPSPLCVSYRKEVFNLDEIIILDGNVVYLLSDNGVARWGFDCLENAKELYRLLVLSVDIESKIATLCDTSK